MKIARDKMRVKIDGKIQTKGFGIVFNSKMVNILSNQLYENKILAIVRELSTNAQDSQTEAGYDKPFDVHLPIWTDETFWIRDYGTGMSPEKIDETYRMYGGSDRTDSNDFTGCMGLGSKTPFCYNTKTFTVESWYDGTYYVYACFLNEDGMPQIASMSHEKSDEPTGVKISLPVKKGDGGEFLASARKIYKFFPIIPNMFGRKVDIKKPDYTLSGDNWKYGKTDSYETMKIIMGGVAYKVSNAALGDLTTIQCNVVSQGFHVYVNVGDVGVTASREGLDYTNRTKTHVRSYINNIITTFNEQFQKKLNKCTNLWEARILYWNTDSHIKLYDVVKITYNGKPLFDNPNSHIIEFEKNDEIVIRRFEYSSYHKPKKCNVSIILPNKQGLKVYFNDLKIGSFVRCIEECKKHQKDVLLVSCKSDIAKQKFIEQMGFDESYITNISTIPSPTVRKNGSRRGKMTRVIRFCPYSYYHSVKSDYWSDTEVDFDSGGLYVEFNRYDYLDGDSYRNYPSILSDRITKLKEVGILVPEVYGVRTADLKKFTKSNKWNKFEEWGKEQLEKKIINKDMYTSTLCNEELIKIGHSSYRSFKFNTANICTIGEKCNPSTNIYSFVETIKDMQSKSKGYDVVYVLRDLCKIFKVALPEYTDIQIKLLEMENAIYEKYPMLRILDSNMDLEKHVDDLCSYVNSIG